MITFINDGLKEDKLHVMATIALFRFFYALIRWAFSGFTTDLRVIYLGSKDDAYEKMRNDTKNIWVEFTTISISTLVIFYLFY